MKKLPLSKKRTGGRGWKQWHRPVRRIRSIDDVKAGMIILSQSLWPDNKIQHRIICRNALRVVGFREINGKILGFNYIYAYGGGDGIMHCHDFELRESGEMYFSID